jgi:hypothetical protein
MRVGIMQPYFFPYLPHFALIANADEWVVFDTSQYKPKSWMNRNRVLHPAGGWLYISVPLAKASQSITTREARLVSPDAARVSLHGSLSHYNRRAPFASIVAELVDRAFDARRSDTLVDLNIAALVAVCDHLGLQFRYRILSEMGLALPDVLGAGEWAPAIARAIGADAYINPASGRHLFDPSFFERCGVDLAFLDMPPLVYDTRPYTFEPYLSILDVLMWNPPDIVREALRRDVVLHGASAE